MVNDPAMQETEMLSTIGAQVKVRVFRNMRDRKNGSDYIEREAVITSAGPPGVQADWARTVDGRPGWLLVRKPVNSGNHKWEAIEGDTGQMES